MKKYEAVAAHLRDRIARSYPPGSELPTRAEMAEQYEVSQNTVAHALEVLRAEGLVETAQGTRTIVLKPPEPQLTMDEVAARLERLEARVFGREQAP